MVYGKASTVHAAQGYKMNPDFQINPIKEPILTVV